LIEHAGRGYPRRITLGLLVAGLASAAASPACFAQALAPPRGSLLRREILDALRPTIAGEIGGTIEFVVTELRVLQPWAYVAARPQRPGGTSIDWSRTRFREAWQADMMSDLVLALLRQDGGRWRVIEYAIGPTDVAWEDWIKAHGAPRQLFAAP
jgi:hypothetical protein